jgi:hypothetical protein
MTDFQKVMEQVNRIAKEGAAKALNAVPSPKGCGCAKRKVEMQDNLRAGVSLKDTIVATINDIKENGFHAEPVEKDDGPS